MLTCGTDAERGVVVETVVVAGALVTVCLAAVSVCLDETEGVVAAGCSLSAVVSRGAVVEADCLSVLFGVTAGIRRSVSDPAGGSVDSGSDSSAGSASVPTVVLKAVVSGSG